MGRPLKWTPEQKLPLVLSVLRGEGSVAEIGRRHRVSDVTLAKWRDAFLAGGAAALAAPGRYCKAAFIISTNSASVFASTSARHSL